MVRVVLVVALAACSSSPAKQSVQQPPVLESVPQQSQPVEAPRPEAHRPPPPDAAPPRPPPDAPSCPVVNPKGCPAAEPNVNRPCDVKGAECVYDDHCCHQITYVCAKNKHFEAHIQRCN